MQDSELEGSGGVGGGSPLSARAVESSPLQGTSSSPSQPAAISRLKLTTSRSASIPGVSCCPLPRCPASKPDAEMIRILPSCHSPKKLIVRHTIQIRLHRNARADAIAACPCAHQGHAHGNSKCSYVGSRNTMGCRVPEGALNIKFARACRPAWPQPRSPAGTRTGLQQMEHPP
ncbi:hypothetical protein K458DRAFT_144484 [Lentithecium fluviatile CBS 122367]|uniref:Uncharacterized protein n=1 Tax=Lentithecium fluviatile CBS 122367 TaxID=1168545 RepID=A0A6G1IIA3_9PLEO|nr:hypothetical protein K458DRAFT_144484 [Lentithecium fluviatile CBS 122367]